MDTLNTDREQVRRLGEHTIPLDLPPVEGELALTESHQPKTSCAQCFSRISQCNALKVRKHTNGQDIEEDFCGEDCANAFYLDRLRNAGL